MVWAVDLIGGNGKGGSKDGPVCYYFGLCFRTQADSALNQSRALTLFVGTCSNWPLFGRFPGASTKQPWKHTRKSADLKFAES
jgi:hypothetical protein